MSIRAERRRVAVIGGGVVGCAVSWELARQGIEAVLLEAQPDIGEGASKANSGILHTGFDSRPGTIEARLLRRAAELWPEVLETLSVPYLRLGAVMVARSADELKRIDDHIVPNAASLGVRAERLDGAMLRDLAPFVVDTAVGGLLVPDEAVVDPFWLTRAFAEAAVSAGVEVRTGSPVVDLTLFDDAIRLRLGDGTELEAEQVFDCAGLQADEVARLVGDDSLRISPRKGQFLVSEEAFGVDRIILPVPGGTSKGMLVTPIAFGGLLLGPTATDQKDKTDRSTDPAAAARIVAACSTLVPVVRRMKPIRSFAGLRTVVTNGDYVIRPSAVSDRLFLVAGIRSTGISASPAIAERVVDEVIGRRGWRRSTVTRQLAPPSIEERPPGEIVCPCRTISRGEVEAACRRPTAPGTLDAVKRRSGAMFGDCQGNGCAVEVAGIIAAERRQPVESIRKGAAGSWLFHRALPVASPTPLLMAPDTSTVAVVVIGGGLAGVGAALSLAALGVDHLLVERRSAVLRPVGKWTRYETERLEPLHDSPIRGLHVRLGETAVGLLPEEGRWRVLTQRADGSRQVVASAVIVATGGYVEPMEHRAVAGPRLAGVCTADLVTSAVGAGLVPGERAVVVGRGRLADTTARSLLAAGCRVEILAGPVAEVRGTARVDGVRIGERWIECDTLVFADRLLAAPFILRGVGLVDALPGVPAPAAADGSLPMPGLWAAGTCVDPDIDHSGSLADGIRVGAAVAGAALAAAPRT